MWDGLPSRALLSVMPEIFYRESKGFKYCGPRLKNCRGDEEVGIHVFAFFFGLKYCGPMIEPFRGDAPAVIPEIFLSGIQRFLPREAFSPSVSLCFLCLLFFKGFIRGIYPLYSSGPRLKNCRGDEKGAFPPGCL